MKVQPEHLLFDGPVGKIEVIVENPGAPRGIAMIGHPHPLFGGGNTNKVVQTLARTFNHLDLRRAASQLSRHRPDRGHA
jgi:alpha/beta superfamily hydrolase